MKYENTDISMFFDTIRVNLESESESKAKTLMDNYLELWKASSKIIKESIYVIDFHKKCFRFVSDQGIFLCGHTSEEVLQLGYQFYRKVIHPEDLPLLAKIHQIIFHCFSRQDALIRDLDCVVFNFRMRCGKKYLMASHKAVPLIVNDSVRLAICTVSDSILQTSGNLYAYCNKGKIRYVYSFEGKRWKLDTQITLTLREKDILKWAKRGKTVNEIADILCLANQTLRNQKVELFDKLGTKNMIQSIIFAENHFLI